MLHACSPLAQHHVRSARRACRCGQFRYQPQESGSTALPRGLPECGHPAGAVSDYCLGIQSTARQGLIRVEALAKRYGVSMAMVDEGVKRGLPVAGEILEDGSIATAEPDVGEGLASIGYERHQPTNWAESS